MSNFTLQVIPKEFYYNNQLLLVDDFKRASDYHTLSLALQNSQAFTSGVLIGFELTSGADGKINLSQGMAFDGNGNQVLLVDQAFYNNSFLAIGNNGFVIDVSSSAFWDKTWCLVTSYYETQNTSKPNEYVIAPKLELIDVSAVQALTPNQVILGNIQVTQSGTTAAPSISLTITVDNRKQVTVKPQLIPDITAGNISGKLSVNQIPPLPFTLIEGKIAQNQIPDIPANSIAGKMDIAQLPDIPASMITGMLTPSQLPPIATVPPVSIHLSNTIITTLQQITVTIIAPDDASFILAFISSGEVVTVDSKKQSNQFTKVPNGYTIPISITQSTAITVTATLKGGEVLQTNSYVQLELTPVSYMSQLKASQTKPADAIAAVVKQFNLQALSNNNIYSLAESMHKAQYTQNDIYQYIAAYYQNLGYDFFKGGYLTFLTAVVKNLNNSTQ